MKIIGVIRTIAVIGMAGVLLHLSLASAGDEEPLGSPKELQSLLSAMKPDTQCDWLATSISRQQLVKASDEQLQAILQSLDSSSLFRPVKRMMEQTPEYEFLMLRRERVNDSDSLPETPERMFVRMRHKPLTVYARWEENGARAGQEVLYDSSKDSRKMLAHAGGILGLVSVNIPINGSMARAQSRHTVRSLGMGFILSQLESDLEKARAQNLPARPSSAKVVREGARRYAEVVFDNPGMPEYYSRQTRFWLDLGEPVIRMVESRDNDGEVFEHIVFQTLTRKKLPHNAFDPKNPEYRF